MSSQAARSPLTGWLALLSVAGCTGPHRQGSAAAVDTLQGTVILEIGEIEGADEYMFGNVIGPAMDSLGRIFVPDYQLSEVRAYGPDGRFLFRVARKGSGPGEVQGPCCLGWDDEGRLWVRDGRNARYQAWRLDANGATYERALRFQHGDANFRAPLTFDGAGRLVDVGHTSGPTPMAAQLARFHLAADGTVEETELIADPSPDSLDMKIVERQSAGRFVRMYAYRPFGSVPLAAHGPRGTWAAAASGYYVIRWVQPDGSERILRRDYAGPPLTGADVRWAEQNLAQTAEWLGTTVARLPFGVPDRKAPLQDLWFDRAGRLWVQVTPPVRTSESLAEIFDSSGTLVAAARWPRSVDLRIGHLTDSVAVGVTRDSLGVARVTVIRWKRGES